MNNAAFNNKQTALSVSQERCIEIKKPAPHRAMVPLLSTPDMENRLLRSRLCAG